MKKVSKNLGDHFIDEKSKENEKKEEKNWLQQKKKVKSFSDLGTRQSEFTCIVCDIICKCKSDYDRHILTTKHKKNMLLKKEKILDKEKPEFYCEQCDYNCNKKSLWEKHLRTKKHKLMVGDEEIDIKKNYNCNFCNKRYLNYKSYWSHTQNCMEKNENMIEDNGNVSNKTYISMINTLMEENKELKNFVIDQSKETRKIVDKVMEIQPHTTINNNTLNNNRLNINVFLNEKCNGAMNLTDFIEKIEVKPSDLENNAQLGFVDGISKIFIDNLKQLSIYERPIHCTDMKRETMYIKDEDTWQKENNDIRLRGAIQEVSRKSMAMLNDWKGENPEYKDANSDFSNKCLVIHKESNAGEHREIFYPKVIKTLAKEISLNDKNL